MNEIQLFDTKQVRTAWNEENEKWYISVIDIIETLTESSIPKRYWSDLKKKLIKEGSQLYDKIVQLKFEAADGKRYLTDCLETQDVFRLIQSIPSPKAEPFKLWLAQIANERINEMQDPELTIDRALEQYVNLGYSENWISPVGYNGIHYLNGLHYRLSNGVNQRLKSIEIRKELTDEWKRLGLKEGQQFATLTDIITKTWSGKNTKEYKILKG